MREILSIAIVFMMLAVAGVEPGHKTTSVHPASLRGGIAAMRVRPKAASFVSLRWAGATSSFVRR